MTASGPTDDRAKRPTEAPEGPVTPPPSESVYDNWAQNSLNRLSGDVGRLQEAVDTLKGVVDRQSSAISGVQTTISTAKGFLICAALVGTGLLAIIAWLVDTGFDKIAEAIAM